MLVDLGLINFAMKTDTKFLFTPQRNMNKLFETIKAAAIPDEPDALIQFHDWPYISYTSLRRLNGTYPRLPISMSPRRLLQVPNKTPNHVAVVRLHHVLELRCRDALLVGLYYAFMILCHDLHLLGFHVSFKYQIKNQNFVVPTRREATRVVWIIN